MAEQRVIVVGGGLAGLGAAVRIAEAGLPWTSSRWSPSSGRTACAPRAASTPATRSPASRATRVRALRRNHLRRRLPRRPAPGPRDGQLGPQDHRPARPHGRALQPHRRGLPRPAPLRRLALQAHPLRRRHHRPAAALRPGRADPPLRERGQGHQVRVLGVPLARSSRANGCRKCVGIVAQDMRTMQIRAFRADAVVMATGGNGLIFGKSTNSVICTGGAASRCYQAGAWYGNPEMIQVHPTAIPGADKLRLMSESARGEGGRVWVPRKKGDTRAPRRSPRTNATTSSKSATPSTATSCPATSPRARSSRLRQRGHGRRWREPGLPRPHPQDPDYLTKKLGGILEIYEKFVGEDPRFTPMKIFPAVHYTMGGLWTDYTKGDYNPAQPRPSTSPAARSPSINRSATACARRAQQHDDQHPGPLRLRRGQLRLPRRQPPRRQRAALLHLRRLFCGVSVVNYVRR
jgi:succinate dehydrogenase / fumarate reductase flavoprotein subunit